MRPESKKEPPTLFDMGDCHDIFTSGVGKMEFLPGNNVRLACYVYEEDGSRRTIVAKCVWAIDDLLDAAEQVTAELAKRGYVRRRLLRAN